MTDVSETKQIQASPTKDFFIFMITKDIDTIDTIIDVADNSIDGARRLRGSESFEGLFIHIEINQDHFQITDNCGGIAIDVARNYAFRFGRAKSMPGTAHSIGNFGVGMKRALFKLGNFFIIESKAENSRFKVNQDIQIWAQQEKWEFEFDEYEENLSIPEKERGTKIVVKQLYEGIRSDFNLDSFKRKLQLELESKHQTYLEQGIEIQLNGILLTASKPKLRSSSKIVPAYKKLEEDDGVVVIKIYAGLGERDPQKAGWNIFCNGRLILEADQTSVTGWGGEFKNRGFHNEYAWFRGFVFFDADQTNLLPWNTTKTSVDLDLPLYKRVQLEMVETMRPVLTFMNKVAEEKKIQENGDITTLEKIINEAPLIKIDEIKDEQSFTAPMNISSAVDSVRISYSKPKDEVDKLKKVLGVKKNPDLGRRTFEYVFRIECDDE
jgi:hypothetical protein